MARYEYETSPRKLEPEYRPNRKKKTSGQNEKKQSKKEVRQKAREKAIARHKAIIKKKRLMVGIGLAFVVLLAISYRNSLINESFSTVKSLKNNLATIEKENEQLQVNIESSINLQSVQQTAEKELGMQKLSPEQKIYISLPKQDYVEAASEEIERDDNKTLLQKIIDFIKGE